MVVSNIRSRTRESPTTTCLIGLTHACVIRTLFLHALSHAIWRFLSAERRRVVFRRQIYAFTVKITTLYFRFDQPSVRPRDLADMRLPTSTTELWNNVELETAHFAISYEDYLLWVSNIQSEGQRYLFFYRISESAISKCVNFLGIRERIATAKAAFNKKIKVLTGKLDVQ